MIALLQYFSYLLGAYMLFRGLTGALRAFAEPIAGRPLGERIAVIGAGVVSVVLLPVTLLLLYLIDATAADVASKLQP